jgi:ABC-type lipoprotein release transport system permease subunit
MGIVRLIIREIAFRKLNFALGAAGVAFAVGCLLAEMVLLRKHDLQTERILAAKETETQAMMNKLEDDFRKITLKLGFNILILPKDQNPGDLYDDEKQSKFFPESHAEKLAKSRVATINHVLPTLTQRVKWPEQQRKVILMGVRGEVYIQSANQKPLLETVAPGQMVAGYELHKSLQLAKGQKVQFMGQEFVISKLMEERGNADDATLWINLNEAQKLLNKPGLINAILALECNCTAERLAVIRAEIGALLPDIKVVEFASQAIARAEARNRAAEQAQASLLQEKVGRENLRKQRESFAALLVPTVLAGAALWIGLLAFGNVRERRQEIGVLRALGVRSRQVLLLFIGKAVLMGVTGAILGAIAGQYVGIHWQDQPDAETVRALMNPQFLIITLLAAPALSILACWVPALLAAQQDPAEILQDR